MKPAVGFTLPWAGPALHPLLRERNVEDDLSLNLLFGPRSCEGSFFSISVAEGTSFVLFDCGGDSWKAVAGCECYSVAGGMRRVAVDRLQFCAR